MRPWPVWTVLDLRDIRSVVVAAEQGARTAKTRAMAEELRSGLAARIESDHSKWLAELAVNISDNKTVRGAATEFSATQSWGSTAT